MQVGTPREIYENPVNAYVASRLGQPVINLVPASLFRGVLPKATSRRARTEHIAIARGGGGVPATVTRIEHLGDQSHIHLDLGEPSWLTLADPDRSRCRRQGRSRASRSRSSSMQGRAGEA